MRILVIGGTGQIGSCVTELLCERGDEVFLFGRKAPKDGLAKYVGKCLHWVEGDVRNEKQVFDSMRAANPTAVVHLAALLQFACQTDPGLAVAVNVHGTKNVLESVCHLGVERLLFGSSVAVYGQRQDLLREDGPIGPGISLYGGTKLLGEQLGNQYAKNAGFQFLALRYCGIFGSVAPASRGMAWVRHQLERTASGESVVIEGASGNERGQLTHFEDAARATVAVLDHPNPPFRTYNVAGGTGNYVTLREFYEAIRTVAPNAGSVQFTGEGRGTGPVSVERLESLGFRPRYSVVDGVRASLERTRPALFS